MRRAVWVACLILLIGVLFCWAQERVPVRRLKVIAVLTRDAEGRTFLNPVAVGIDPATYEVYVVDPGRWEITVFSPDFFPRYSLGKGRGIFLPYGVAIDEEGRIYVCQAYTGKKPARLTVLNGAGIIEKEIVFKDMPFNGADGFAPNSVAVGRRHIYVAGSGFEGVVVLDREGHFVRVIRVRDHPAPELPRKWAQISDVYVDSRGRVYLLSAEMGRFYVFDSLGHFLFKGGKKGGGPGKLSRPRGIAADPELGLILVVDYMRHTGLAYSYREGHFLFEFGGRGWSPGWFNYPTDIAVDPAGRIYVADLFNHRVQVFVFGEEEGVFSPSPSFITPLRPLEIPKKKPGKKPK